MITTVLIAGVGLDPDTVSTEAITVLHGRGAVDDGPSASSATLSLLTSTMPTWSTGDTLKITSEWGPLFDGIITDREIPEHIQTVERGTLARIQLTAAGAVATLGRRPVGDEPWPQEMATDRAGRILALAGVPYQVDTSAATAVEVTPRDVDARTALDLLTELAADTAAAVIDTPDGRVIYQPLEARSRPMFYLRWQDFPDTSTWAGFPATATWDDFAIVSPGSDIPLRLPPPAVGYEPQWRSSAAHIVNSVRIGYGIAPEGGDVDRIEIEDAPSIARYGRLHWGGDTQLARLEDAQTMASRILSTRAWERWMMGSVDVYADSLDDPTHAAVAALLCGDWVQVDGLPSPAPATSWAGICEGWAYREWVKGDTRHAAWTLALSDPLLSLAVPTWADHTPDLEWRQYQPLITWADMTSLDAIGA